jgi:hypothetical protein
MQEHFGMIVITKGLADRLFHLTTQILGTHAGRTPVLPEKGISLN